MATVVTDAGMGNMPTGGTSPEGPLTPKPAPTNVVYNPGEAGLAMDPGYTPTGVVGPLGGAPNAEPRAIMSPESTAYLEALIPGGSAQALQDGYGFGANTGCAGCYDGYLGWDPNLHTGMDISTGGAPAEYSAVGGGTVVCVMGEGSTGGPGCGAYPDYSRLDADGNPMSGNITVQGADGSLTTYGHSSASALAVGDPVAAGEMLGVSGNMNGYHVHLEVQLPIGANGEYVLVDPNVYYNGGYCDRGFCPSAAPAPAPAPAPAQTYSAPAPTQTYSAPAAVQPYSAPAPAATNYSQQAPIVQPAATRGPY
jgi:murein DD-endopeptidase MepM/ murein hydrolase activator NlpD